LADGRRPALAPASAVVPKSWFHLRTMLDESGPQEHVKPAVDVPPDRLLAAKFCKRVDGLHGHAVHRRLCLRKMNRTALKSGVKRIGCGASRGAHIVL